MFGKLAYFRYGIHEMMHSKPVHVKLEYEDKVIEDFSVPVSMKRGIIMKGRVTDEGLADFRYATIVKETDDELDMLPQPGSYYIYKDGDGTASSYDW